MASFSLLPAELVEYIVSYLPQHDIYAVCQINKGLLKLAIPFLYRHVDLFIPPNNRLPRIDRFCLAIINSTRKANNIKSIRLGLSPNGDVSVGQRWLPPDKNFDDQVMFWKAMTVLGDETLVATGDYLRDAISMREYSAYAALILLVLPNLSQLDVADYKSVTFHHLHTILRNLDPETAWNKRYPSRILLSRLSTIKRLSLMFDSRTGVAYQGDSSRMTLDHFLNIPSIETLELSHLKWPAGLQHINTAHPHLANPIVDRSRATNITTLVFRHSGAFTPALPSLLQCMPKLRSFTYEFFFPGPLPPSHHHQMLSLDAWSDHLRRFSSTLQVLVLSAEYCDTSAYFFQQPRISEMLMGYLDLTPFTALHTLEVPFPFLTGDVDFSITKEIYPLLPPNLQHLTLRPDLSHAHLPFPLDESILPHGLTFAESKDMAQYRMNARMDVSYMFQAALSLLDLATTTTSFRSLSVWQPADPGLSWFDGQIQDFATTCRNKNVTGRLLEPMLLRWKNGAEHWDLVREITLFESESEEEEELLSEARANVLRERFWRGEGRLGQVLGLGCQFHVDALCKGRVTAIRRPDTARHGMNRLC